MAISLDTFVKIDSVGADASCICVRTATFVTNPLVSDDGVIVMMYPTLVLMGTLSFVVPPVTTLKTLVGMVLLEKSPLIGAVADRLDAERAEKRDSADTQIAVGCERQIG